MRETVIKTGAAGDALDAVRQNKPTYEYVLYLLQRFSSPCDSGVRCTQPPSRAVWWPERRALCSRTGTSPEHVFFVQCCEYLIFGMWNLCFLIKVSWHHGGQGIPDRCDSYMTSVQSCRCGQTIGESIATHTMLLQVIEAL